MKLDMWFLPWMMIQKNQKLVFSSENLKYSKHFGTFWLEMKEEIAEIIAFGQTEEQNTIQTSGPYFEKNKALYRS